MAELSLKLTHSLTHSPTLSVDQHIISFWPAFSNYLPDFVVAYISSLLVQMLLSKMFYENDLVFVSLHNQE
jgi:hypothetical protein